MTKSSRKILMLVIALAIISNLAGVHALGVTPGRTTLDFEPGLKKNVDVIVINSQKSNVELSIIVQGELKQAVTLKQTSLFMRADEEEKKIFYEISLPVSLEPGLHTAEIVVKQKLAKTSGGQANIGTELAVATQVAVFVPYPGKYLDAQLLISGDEKRKKFTVSMVNRGSETIEKASAVIEVYDSEQKHVKKIETNSISLKPSQKGEVYADWVVNVPKGRYKAKAVINYDGKEIYVEKDFDVGEFVLDLMQIFVKDFKLGGIAKFHLVVKNKWNEPITKAYSEMRVYDEDMEEIADVKSATYDIPADTKTEMIYYWDTKDVSQGLYNGNVILYYADKKTQQDIRLDVKEDSLNVLLGHAISSETGGKEGSSLVTILGAIIGFLIILNVLWFIILRKRRSKYSR